MIDPIAFHVLGLSIRWYGIAWAIAFAIMLYIPSHRVKQSKSLSVIWQDLVCNTLLACVVGGRLGEMLFYQYARMLSDPWIIIRIYEGGMSFHGALLAGVLVFYFTAKRHRINFWDIADGALIHLPCALGIVRVANYINGELCGRVTSGPFGVLVDGCGGYLVFPSQLYEAMLEGGVLWLFLYGISLYEPRRGIISSAFIVGYASMRLLVEVYFRAPTYELTSYLSTGALMSIVMLAAGLLVTAIAASHTHDECQGNKAKSSP